MNVVILTLVFCFSAATGKMIAGDYPCRISNWQCSDYSQIWFFLPKMNCRQRTNWISNLNNDEGYRGNSNRCAREFFQGIRGFGTFQTNPRVSTKFQNKEYRIVQSQKNFVVFVSNSSSWRRISTSNSPPKTTTTYSQTAPIQKNFGNDSRYMCPTVIVCLSSSLCRFIFQMMKI